MNNNTIGNDDSNSTVGNGQTLPEDNMLHIMLRHRWTILSVTILFLAVGFIYLLKATPIFTSETSLYVEQSGPKIIGEYEGYATQSNNYLYTQAKLIQSVPIISAVVDNPQFADFRTFENIDNPVGYVQKHLAVEVGKKDDIVTISFDSPYPVEAAQIVNALRESYVDHHSKRKSSIVARVRRLLEQGRDDKALKKIRQQWRDFIKENGAISFENKDSHPIFQKLSKLSAAWTDAQLETINARANYEAVKSMMDEPARVKQYAAASTEGVRVYVNDVETELRRELKQEELELKNLKHICTDDHPAVQSKLDKIENIKDKLNNEAKEFAQAYLDRIELKWITAKQNEEELRVSFEAQDKAAQNLVVMAGEYSILQSEKQRMEDFYDSINDNIRRLSVTEDSGALNISVLEVGRPATSPSKPQKARVMALALFLGLMCGVGISFMRDWMDYRLRSADEIAAVLGVPVLGVIPTMPRSQEGTIPIQKGAFDLNRIITRSYQTIHTFVVSRILKGDLQGAVIDSVVSVDNNQIDKEGVVNCGQKVHLKPKSVVAEAYRTIRTAIFFGLPKGQAKTILITSPSPGDGKSTLASNLALTMAQAGQKTLILDADFRKPMQHNIFQTDNQRGLSHILAGSIPLDEAIYTAPIDKLNILTCGADVPNPSEILNSDPFAEMLKELCSRYDRIIIDSPPVGPVADSQILAAICDITLLVLRAEKSTRKHSQHARDSLLSVGGHLLGAVVNDVPQSHGRYGYYSNYGNYGSYGHYGYYSKKKEKEYV